MTKMLYAKEDGTEEIVDVELDDLLQMLNNYPTAELHIHKSDDNAPLYWFHFYRPSSENDD